MTGICLTMIVKDEAAVLGRCIASVREWIDCYAIVDTGSSDATRELAAAALEGLPGLIVARPWQGFAQARNDALAVARSLARPPRYTLMMDADHVLRIPRAAPPLDPAADGFYLEHRYANLRYDLPILLRTHLPWRYALPVHEYLECDVPYQLGKLPCDKVWIDVHTDGARSRDPDKYKRDASALKAYLVDHPLCARAWYYYAQSLRDAGALGPARLAYLHRAAMGGWAEEKWSALYEAAKCLENSGHDEEQVPAAYLAAYGARRERAEPLVRLAAWYRVRGEHALAYLFAKHAVETPYPWRDSLFIEAEAYGWKALDELAIAAFYSGDHAIGKLTMIRLLDCADVPPEHAKRIRDNALHYQL